MYDPEAFLVHLVADVAIEHVTIDAVVCRRN